MKDCRCPPGDCNRMRGSRLPYRCRLSKKEDPMIYCNECRSWITDGKGHATKCSRVSRPEIIPGNMTSMLEPMLADPLYGRSPGMAAVDALNELIKNEKEPLGEVKLPPDPKQAFGDTKPNVALIPGTASAYLALGFECGAAKYGPFNWRNKAVEAMTYVAACKRHLDAWVDGEEVSSDTVTTDRPVPNLAHALASLAIIVDALELGNLIDNRPLPGASSKLHDRIATQRKAADKEADEKPMTAAEVLAAQGRPLGTKFQSPLKTAVEKYGPPTYQQIQEQLDEAEKSRGMFYVEICAGCGFLHTNCRCWSG